MSLKHFIGQRAGQPVARGVEDHDDSDLSIEDALALVEKRIADRYPVARGFLPRYRNDARAILRELHERWRRDAP